MAAGSSDRPVATGVPLEIIQSMVQRIDAEGVVVAPEERVSVEQALWSYTVGSAQVTGQADSKGSLVPGMLADFVVLGRDPLETPVEEIAQIPVLATVVAGQAVCDSVGLDTPA